jgi:hypothetical protein
MANGGRWNPLSWLLLVSVLQVQVRPYVEEEVQMVHRWEVVTKEGEEEEEEKEEVVVVWRVRQLR